MEKTTEGQGRKSPKPEKTLAERLKEQRSKKSNIKRRKDGTIQ